MFEDGSTQHAEAAVSSPAWDWGEGAAWARVISAAQSRWQARHTVWDIPGRKSCSPHATWQAKLSLSAAQRAAPESWPWQSSSRRTENPGADCGMLAL
jgi:hypothetical protein